MALDVYLSKVRPIEEKRYAVVFTRNITHALIPMAEYLKVYEPIWVPEENNIYQAKDLIPILEKAITKMKKNPARCKKYNPKKAIGTYEEFLLFLSSYLEYCVKYPESFVSISR